MRIFLLIFFTAFFLQAQNDTIVGLKPMNNVKTLDSLALAKIDSIWIENLYKSSALDSVFTVVDLPDSNQTAYVVDLPTDTLKKRLAFLDAKTPFHMTYNVELERVIKSYLKHRRKYYPAMMAKAAYYFPLFEAQLARYELPLEIKYLAIVESALRPRAKSGVGATGLWQFMYQTGKMFDLKVSSYVDERQDPVKSTQAACQYLEQLYHSFNDWDLALAAYNSGPGNVSKAIRRSGNRTNYWNIRPFLPKETSDYLPAFYATLYIFEYAKAHGIHKEQPRIHQFETDSIKVKQLLTFQQIHDMIGTDIEMLSFLNPSYKLNIVPFVKNRDYQLVLPLKDALNFVDKENEIYAYATQQISEREKPLPKYFEMSQRIRYKVRSGDYLGLIAERHGVYVRDLKKWNRLSSTNLKIGQRLTIYPKRINYTVQKKRKKIKETPVKVPAVGKKKYHTIVSGDNLWDLSKKYHVTVTALKSWNNLWNHNNLKLGDFLVIYQN